MANNNKNRRLSVTASEARVLGSLLDMVQKKFTYNKESERFECNVGDSIVGYEFPAFAEIGTLKEKLWKSGMRG